MADWIAPLDGVANGWERKADPVVEADKWAATAMVTVASGAITAIRTSFHLAIILTVASEGGILSRA